MKMIGVVTDSHSSISPEEAEKLGVFVLPAAFYVDGKLYHEGVDLTRKEFFEKQVSGSEIFTSQPSVQELMDIWNQALEVYEKILYIPISSGLSGSCNTAMLLSSEEPYKDRVFVVDNGRVSVPQYCTIPDAFKKSRGMHRAKREMFDAVRFDLETRFKPWYERREFYLMTATAVEKEDNDAFVKKYRKLFLEFKYIADCWHWRRVHI